MTNVHSKPKTIILLSAMVGVLIVAFFFAAVRAARRASKNLERHNEEYVYGLESKWIDGEITKLSSGQTSSVLFYATSNSDLHVNRLAGRAEVKSLTFWETDLSDIGLSIIASLPCIEKLTINGGSVSDSGLESLRQNQILTKLHLVNVNLSNDGLVVLQSIPNLDYVTVYCGRDENCKLNDAAVPFLGNLKRVKKMNVGGGWISRSAMATLKTSLPSCEIVEVFADDEW